MWSGAPRGDGGIQGHGDESTRLLQLQKRSVHFEFTISLTTASLFQPAPIQKKAHHTQGEHTRVCAREGREREGFVGGRGWGRLTLQFEAVAHFLHLILCQELIPVAPLNARIDVEHDLSCPRRDSPECPAAPAPLQRRGSLRPSTSLEFLRKLATDRHHSIPDGRDHLVCSPCRALQEAKFCFVGTPSFLVCR